MRSSVVALLIGVLVSGALGAQQPSITPEMQVDAVTLRQWLRSGDPRLIAWAADFARRNHEGEVVGEIPEMLLHTPWVYLPANGSDESQAAQRRSVLALLDTVIQEGVEVPIPSIRAIAPGFPGQAAILVARLPLSESRKTLQEWSGDEARTRTGPVLARIASMLLARDPLPSHVFWNRQSVSFVAGVVDASEEQVVFTVRKNTPTGLGNGSNACGDSLGRPIASGWPQVFTYGLDETTQPKGNGPVVVKLDDDQIFYWRVAENEGSGSCSGSGVQPLNPSTRHRLLAYWLGVPVSAMAWKPVETYPIVWTNEAAYQRRLGQIVEEQRQKLDRTVEGLRRRGLLREQEVAEPRLVVTIRCEIEPCPLASAPAP